ncbi:MAG: hypothetical protein K2Y32_16645 [Candidatus Obscuribacterales bacterium]|nr:hypothetical protein [Candidatus Obscuribacterales bacterium]
MQNLKIIDDGITPHLLRQMAGGALHKLFGNKGGLRLGPNSRRCGGLTSSRVSLN